MLLPLAAWQALQPLLGPCDNSYKLVAEAMFTVSFTFVGGYLGAAPPPTMARMLLHAMDMRENKDVHGNH